MRTSSVAGLVGGDEREAAQHHMGPAGEGPDPRPGLSGVLGLAEQAAVEDDIGIDPEGHGVGPGRGAGLAQRVLDDEHRGLALGQLLDAGHHDLELEAEQAEQLSPARRGRGEDQLLHRARMP